METNLIHVQRPEKTGSEILAIIEKYLKDEEHYEQFIKAESFRGVLLRKLLEEINSN